jgi:hypothetical protein
MEPEKPRTLVWRVGDPIGHTMKDAIVLQDGSLFLWCDPDQIAMIARTPVSRKRASDPVTRPQTSAGGYIGTDLRLVRADAGTAPDDAGRL